MSDRQCNYCIWLGMKNKGYRIATKKEEDKLKSKKDTEFNSLFPKGVTILDKKGKYACWFAELPNHCCC